MSAGPPEAEAATDPGLSEFVRYLFWSLPAEWRRQPLSARRAAVEQAAVGLSAPPEGLRLRSYSLLGSKATAQGLLWMSTARFDALAEVEAGLLAGPLGGYVGFPHSYLGLRRPSEYGAGHVHADQEGPRVEPRGLPFLFVYPFVKKREWYGLPFEERRRVMAEHFRIGHRFPGVTIHTGYSFGLDDAEFILAFEAESPGEFLELVRELRSTEASRYTALETPTFTCRAVPFRRALEMASGIPE